MSSEAHQSGINPEQEARHVVGGEERYIDAVVREYMKDVDQTLLRENLKLTVEERFLKFERFMEYIREL